MKSKNNKPLISASIDSILSPGSSDHFVAASSKDKKGPFSLIPSELYFISVKQRKEKKIKQSLPPALCMLSANTLIF